MTRDRLLQLLGSGELYRLARQCKTQRELSEKIGLSDDAYEICTRRIRARGQWFPRFHELLTGVGWSNDGQVPGLPPEQPEDFDEEEPTQESSHVASADTHSTAAVTSYVVSGQSMMSTGQVSSGIEYEEEQKAPPSIWDEIEARKTKAANAQLKAKLAEALDQLAQCRLQLETATGAAEARQFVEPIKPREKASSLLREATAVALASDWHIEEQVDPASVNGVNAYNLEIAKHRCERFFSGFNYLIQYHQDHFLIRDGLLWLGGDLITGYLREENLEHNLLSPVQAIATLHVWLADGIRSVLAAGNLETLRVVCNSGNHGRLTEKVRPSTREANSIEWLLYTALAREFSNDPRVSFSLPFGSQTYVDVYDWTIRFTHGDEAKFGGGVGGIMIPLKKAMARWQTYMHADLTVVGHFHQYHDLPSLVVNGSLIGYNPFALSIGAEFEEPRQAFFLMDRRRGKTMPADIWVTDADEIQEEA